MSLKEFTSSAGIKIAYHPKGCNVVTVHLIPRHNLGAGGSETFETT